MKLRRALVAVVAALGVLAAGCAARSGMGSPPVSAPSSAVEQLQNPSEPEAERISRSVLLAVGDNLIHDVIYQQAGRRTGGVGYDFAPVYAHLSAEIAAADVAFINQETPMVEGVSPSSYPRFNTPVEMAQALRTVGFDLLNVSNNHMLDKGADGLEKTIQLIRSTQGLTVAGGYVTSEEREQLAVVTSNDIRFAFLGFTQHTNGLSLPEGREYMAIYTDDTAEMERQIARAHAQADVVVVSVHWGEENVYEPTSYQREKAQVLAQAGADIILGTHPHVLQPIEMLQTTEGRTVPVLYSLGNFVSAQDRSANMLGGMATIAVEKNQTTGAVTIERPQMTPIVTHYGAGMREVTLYPLRDYTDALAAEHGVRISSGRRFDRVLLDELVKETIDPIYLEKATNTTGEETLT